MTTPPSEPGEQSPGHDPAAQLTWRIAVLAALSALAGALVGVVGAVVTTGLTLDHSDDQVLDAQRREAYVAYLAAADEIVNQIKSERREGELPPADETRKRDLIDAPNRLKVAMAALEIYGTEDAVAGANKLSSEVNVVVLFAAGGSTDNPAGIPGSPEGTKDGLSDALIRAGIARQDFLAVLREELSS